MVGAATEVNLALSSAKASQNALWVMKLSFLEKKRATITLVLPRSTGLGMGLPIRLNCILLGALVALPLLLSVFPAIVRLDPRQFPQRPSRIVVDARWLGAYVHTLPHLRARPLLQLPRQVVASPVKL